MKHAAIYPKQGSQPAGRNARQFLLATATGFAVGILAGSAYLLLGGNDWYFMAPLWARVVIYPGFVVGEQVYQWGLPINSARVVGVLMVGLTYAVIVLMTQISRPLIRRRS